MLFVSLLKKITSKLNTKLIISIYLLKDQVILVEKNLEKAVII
jgi:hypothetical protein